MSGSPESMSQQPTSSPEKPSFTKTCSLLSQYLKEKGSFGDLSLGMTCKVEGTPDVNSSPDQMSGNVCVGGPRNLRSMDLFPQHAGFSMPARADDGPKRVESSVTSMNICGAPAETRTAPMTIFYGGRVIVLNDLPADKAKEIILLATKCSSKSRCESGLEVHPTSNNGPNLENNVSSSHEFVQRPAHGPILGKLPIARGASLHRFLEKRKDRIASKAPYKISNSSAAASPSKPMNSKSWLGLAVEPQQ